MANNDPVKIYIESKKAYYYPGEQYLASVLMEVLQKVKCNKMIIIAKGKQIINATQRKFDMETQETQNKDVDSEEEEEQREEIRNKQKHYLNLKKLFKYQIMIS